MADPADHVGYITGERSDGYYEYGCESHAPQSIKDQPHRRVLREETEEEGATCEECGYELAEAEVI